MGGNNKSARTSFGENCLGVGKTVLMLVALSICTILYSKRFQWKLS